MILQTEADNNTENCLTRYQRPSDGITMKWFSHKMLYDGEYKFRVVSCDALRLESPEDFPSVRMVCIVDNWFGFVEITMNLASPLAVFNLMTLGVPCGWSKKGGTPYGKVLESFNYLKGRPFMAVKSGGYCATPQGDWSSLKVMGLLIIDPQGELALPVDPSPF